MIDGSEGNVEACREEVKKKGFNDKIPIIETKWITPDNYKDIIPQTTENILITGIHQCGDLSSSSIKEFVRNPKVTDLAVVGCCYNCLTEIIGKE